MSDTFDSDFDPGEWAVSSDDDEILSDSSKNTKNSRKTFDSDEDSDTSLENTRKKIKLDKPMDLQVLSGKYLEKQFCTNCLQYLSVLPVTITKNRETLCGRCNVDLLNSNNEHSKHTMFNVVAKQFLFKCVNHFEGCLALLEINRTVDHEGKCQYEKHECFFCSFTGNWSQIICHCSQEHPENITQDGLFQFEVGSELSKKLIYVVNSNIFLYTIQITEQKFFILISAKTKNDFGISQFVVKFFKPSDPQEAEIMSTDYSLFDINCENVFEKHGEVLISEFGRKTIISCQIILKQVDLSFKEMDLEKKWQQIKAREVELNKQKLSIIHMERTLQHQKEMTDCFSNLLKKMSTYFKCSDCQKLIIEAIYFCPKNHFYCETCLTGTCKLCNKICEFTKILEFSKISVVCDWPGCKISVNLPNYLEHKYFCASRPYKCPIKECLEIIYSHEKLKDHWHCQVPPLVTENFVEHNKYGDHEWYWLLNSELYHVVIRFIKSNLQVLIENVNVLSDKIEFKTEGSFNSTTWELLKPMDFCGRYQIISTNRNQANTHNFTSVKVTASGFQEN